MRLKLKTVVKRDFDTVVRGFNRNLFEYLVPGWGLPVFKRYDGQQHGDMVHIVFRFPWIIDWMVVVKEAGMTDKTYWFTHRGLKIPLGLVFWQHVHRVVAMGKQKTGIIDNIEFQSKWAILNPLNYLVLLFIFFPRKILYRRYYHKIFEK